MPGRDTLESGFRDARGWSVMQSYLYGVGQIYTHVIYVIVLTGTLYYMSDGQSHVSSCVLPSINLHPIKYYTVQLYNIIMFFQEHAGC